jgi:hypothetical protein
MFLSAFGGKASTVACNHRARTAYAQLNREGPPLRRRGQTRRALLDSSISRQVHNAIGDTALRDAVDPTATSSAIIVDVCSGNFKAGL